MSKSSFSQDLRVEVAGNKASHFSEGQSPGESGVRAGRVRLGGRALMRVLSPDHWIIFELSGATDIDCRIADRRLVHRLRAGTMAMLPAGAEAVAATEGPIDALVIRVAASRVAVGAAEREGRAAGLIERLCGRDDDLMRYAASLFAEVRSTYLNGPLFWNETADRIVDRLLDNHLSRPPQADRRYLPAATVTRLVDYVRAHIADPLDVAALAEVAGLSRYHFTRLFTRSVGMTPHRYVTKMRLDEAVALARGRRLPLAEVALATGFADQSHLSRWVRRVHGTTLSRLAA